MSECFACRCEEITTEKIERAIAAGARTVNDVKRQTKAGMGLCQGVFCVSEIVRLLAAAEVSPEHAIAPMTARPPVRLITLEALAQSSNDETS